jgi:predicted AlkP superfamily phosphohydrolase/phosphomutase
MRVKSRSVVRGVLAAGLPILLLLVEASPSHAYIGPGAGFAFVSSFFILLATLGIAVLTLLTWPIRWIVRALVSTRKVSRARVKRVIVVGFDGQDPELTERYMSEGLLPNFAKLRDQGAFERLQTTLPAESPVAWSSFQTGCNPGKHRIYDFLVPNRKSLLPELSSASVSTAPRSLKIGKYRLPLGKPATQVRRKSQPFWKLLGDAGVFSNILRVPITFPPEKFNGVMLSGMCVPDLKGSQGTFFYYTTDSEEERRLTSGIRMPLTLDDGTAGGNLSGPENSMVENGEPLLVPFHVRLESDGGDRDADLVIDKKTYPLRKGEYTPWIQVAFRPGLGVKVYGLCRFVLLETTPHVRLYVTPIQIDPENPAMPISHPATYSMYLAKTQGPYATLGLAEDTSGLNEAIIDEQTFLAQCDFIHEEREGMFFDALEKTPRGLVVCVFDITDRVQHMFFRCMDEGHPANQGKEVERYRGVIQDVYTRMDGLVGRILDGLDEDTVLMVMSDHGFKPFRRGVNLNAWLRDKGYLAVRDDAESEDMLQAVDWSRTKAYAVGFGGLYLNLSGREAHGIVSPGAEEEALKREIAEGLLALQDDSGDGESPVKQVYDRSEAYKGPYVNEAPDLIVGFRPGYRVAWRAVTGGMGDRVFEDNERPWSGDHNMNPSDVPGMLFVNRHIAKGSPHIEDIAPTVLDLFGVPIPEYVDGVALMPEASS